ncbi:MAG: TPM domain-containing protein [Anaerolineae bacterium]|nr:TPM domain-containing protein [Anaerolineae bacterium]
MRKMLGFLFGLLMSLWLGVSLAMAQSGYPQPTDAYINDFAHLLNESDAAPITKLLSELKRQRGIEATVVTLNSMHDYPTGDETIEVFAAHLFNTWGIGDKANHKGVLILVAVQDRKVRIELGTGYESQYNDEMQQIINEHMLPAFKQGDYSHGLYQGTRAIIATLTGVWLPDERPVQSRGGGSSVPVAEVSPRQQSDTRMGTFLFSAFVVIVGYLILAHIFGWPVGNGRSDDDDKHPSWSSRSSSGHSSSSSSNSSFGGGRSSGGGASGSW